jgi:hypothetical protein
VSIKPIELVILYIISVVVIGDGIVLAGSTRMRALESGGYEILLGVTLACLTSFYWIKENRAGWMDAQGGLQVASAFGILFGYAIVMPHLGYLLSSFLAVVAYMRGLGGYRWRMSLIFAVVFAVASAWLWARLIIILPQGPLPWPEIS